MFKGQGGNTPNQLLKLDRFRYWGTIITLHSLSNIWYLLILIWTNDYGSDVKVVLEESVKSHLFICACSEGLPVLLIFNGKWLRSLSRSPLHGNPTYIRLSFQYTANRYCNNSIREGESGSFVRNEWSHALKDERSVLFVFNPLLPVIHKQSRYSKCKYKWTSGVRFIIPSSFE